MNVITPVELQLDPSLIKLQAQPRRHLNLRKYRARTIRSVSLNSQGGFRDVFPHLPGSCAALLFPKVGRSNISFCRSLFKRGCRLGRDIPPSTFDNPPQPYRGQAMSSNANYGSCSIFNFIKPGSQHLVQSIDLYRKISIVWRSGAGSVRPMSYRV